MFVANYRPHPKLESDFKALKNHKKFWFPHRMKYVAWGIVFIIIMASSSILIVYGMNFGMLKTYLWLTGVLSTLLLSIMITSPVRIFIVCLLETLAKKKTHIYSRQLAEEDLHNPEDPEKKLEVEKKRKYKEHLYKPIPEYKLRHRLEDVKYNIEMRNIAVDTVSYVVFLVVAMYVTFINKTDMTYYSTQVIKSLVINVNYTSNKIKLEEVRQLYAFYTYINYSFLPALLLSDETYSEIPNIEYYKTHTHDHATSGIDEYYNTPIEEEYYYDLDFDDPDAEKKVHSNHFIDVRGSHINENSDNEFSSSSPEVARKKKKIHYSFEELIHRHVFDRGWTLEPCLKLLGRPRMRQIRVVKAPVGGHAAGFQSKRASEADEFYFLNEEKGLFTINWDPPPQKGLSSWQGQPWRYRTGWETKSLPILGKFRMYPSGGYVVEFARNLRDARIVLNFLHEFNWIDTRTRAVFIEFTTYCVNTNMFNVVTLIFEKSAVGYIVASYEIQSCRFLYGTENIGKLYIVCLVIFTLLLFFFLLRESMRVHRTSIRMYFKRPVSVMDIGIIVVATLCLVFNLLRLAYIRDLLQDLQEARNNIFVSFLYAGFWCEANLYVEAILALLAAFKLLRVLSFRVVFYRLQVTLSRSLRHFLDLALEVIILLSAFSLFFHFMLVYTAQGFMTFGSAFSTLIGRIIVIEDDFDITVLSAASTFLAPVFFFLFVISVTVLFVNIFIAVICLYFREIQKVKLLEKYELLKYIKHIVTSHNQADILPLSNKIPTLTDERTLRLTGGSCDAENLDEEEQNDKNIDLLIKSDVLRLRGGGNMILRDVYKENDKKQAKEKEKDGENYPKKKKKKVVEAEEEMYDKIKLSGFIFERQYETSDVRDVPLDRFSAMEYLTIAFLSDDKVTKEWARINAVAAVFLNLTRGRNLFPRTPEKFFIIKKPKLRYVILGKKLKDMKVLIESYGRRKKWIVDEIPLTELEERIYHTLRKLQLINQEINSLLSK